MRRLLIAMHFGLLLGGLSAFAISAYSLWRRDFGPALFFLVFAIWADHLFWRGRNL